VLNSFAFHSWSFLYVKLSLEHVRRSSYGNVFYGLFLLTLIIKAETAYNLRLRLKLICGQTDITKLLDTLQKIQELTTLTSVALKDSLVEFVGCCSIMVQQWLPGGWSTFCNSIQTCSQVSSLQAFTSKKSTTLRIHFCRTFITELKKLCTYIYTWTGGNWWKLVVCHGSLSLLCMMKVRVWKQLLTFFSSLVLSNSMTASSSCFQKCYRNLKIKD